VGLFDTTEEHPPSKIRRYIITGVAGLVLAFLFLWYWPGNLRFYKERRIVDDFMSAVVAGNLQEAYKIWKPSQSYEYKDFLEDWGPNGYYGPIRSYRIDSTQGVDNAPSAAIVVDVSPYTPFPSGDDEVKQAKTQKITLWVDPKDDSISFPPY
jgi:hypothetical protein